jgi:hypothetical protein
LTTGTCSIDEITPMLIKQKETFLEKKKKLIYDEELMIKYLAITQGWVFGYVRERNSVRVH